MWPIITGFGVVVMTRIVVLVFFFECAMNIAFNRKEEER